jgi:F0F1-type ATP synthase membrane subunit b/b'
MERHLSWFGDDVYEALNEAKAEAHRLVSEARNEAELTTGAARREVEELTRQKDAVTAQLGQMLSGLAGIVPSLPTADKSKAKD